MAQSCEQCSYWKKGDVSLSERIDNAGQCVYFMELIKHDTFNKFPFWMKNQTRQTISWEGGSCTVFKI